MELPPKRIFTVAEAEGLLDTMRAVLAEIDGHMAKVRALTDRLAIFDALWGERVREPGNPDRSEFHQVRDDAAVTVERIEELIRDEILARGVRFPVGGIEHGLLDFPTTLDGRVVFLCWKLDEPRLQHWHEVDGGFAGRKPLTREIARRMGD
jgi:hypothetical protein